MAGDEYPLRSASRRMLHAIKAELRYGYNPYRIWYVSPELISHVTPASDIVDLSQHKADRSHPHAFLDRGYFKEERRIGSVIDGEWDHADTKFEDLLEHKAIRDVMGTGCDWNETEFAGRAMDYIRAGSVSRRYSTVEDYAQGRKKEVHELIESIKTNGVCRVSRSLLSSNVFDEIGVNVARDGRLLFNNRGHHRLSIAKVLGICRIPVLVIVWHAEWVRRHGFRISRVVAGESSTS